MIGYEWIRKYLGNGYKVGSNGPEVWDCWTLFRDIQVHHFGLQLGEVGDLASNPIALRNYILDQAKSDAWQKVNDPIDGDAVLMFKGKFGSHVGVWLGIDNGRIIHTVQGSGTVCTSIPDTRRMGWSRIEYYRSKV